MEIKKNKTQRHIRKQYDVMEWKKVITTKRNKINEAQINVTPSQTPSKKKENNNNKGGKRRPAKQTKSTNQYTEQTRREGYTFTFTHRSTHNTRTLHSKTNTAPTYVNCDEYCREREKKIY